MKRSSAGVHGKEYRGGFALPTVIIASVVVIGVLSAAIAAVTSIRTSIQQLQYTQLARAAAEAGVARAQSCLEASGNVAQWSASSPLRANTNCDGSQIIACPTTLRDSRCGVIDSPGLRTNFEIGTTTVDSDGRTVIIAKGTVELLRTSSSAVWRTIALVDRVQVGAFRAWELTTQFASGYYNTVMILNDGQAYGVGQNNFGQLGQGNYDTVTKFGMFRLNEATGRLTANPLTVRAVVANWSSMFVLASDGQVYGAGSQAAGALGDGISAPGYTSSDNYPTTYRTAIPTRYRLPAGWIGREIIPTSAGVTYVLAAPATNPSDVQLYGAGRNDQGILGDGTFDNQSIPVRFNVDNAVGRVSSGHLTIKKVSSFSASGLVNQRAHTCVIASDDEVYCAGREDKGQFGTGSTVSERYNIPRRAPLPAGIKAKDIFTADGVTYVLGNDNQLYGAGSNVTGRLGDGTTASRATFEKVRLDLAIGRASDTLTVKQVAILDDSIHILASDDNVYSVGANGEGRFGNGTATNSSLLTKMNPPLASGEKVAVVKTGGSKTLSKTVYLLTTNGRVMAVGDNTYGQIADGTTTDRSTPHIWAFPGGGVATDIQPSTFANRGTIHVMLSDGRIYAAGDNSNGEIGDGTTTNRSSPTRMDLSLPIPRTMVYY